MALEQKVEWICLDLPIVYVFEWTGGGIYEGWSGGDSLRVTD